jgi:cell filamentation protein
VSDDDEAARLAEQKAREQHEADLVDNRIGELYENPIKGNFDANHLKAIHRYIFQDLPHHQPGIVREDTESWVKHRALESRPVVYDVHYASQGIESKIADILEQFGGPDTIKGLTSDDAATRLAELYGDLDHAHGFNEGNSRTLREFSRELAEEAGFNLDWVKTGIEAQQRNELYIARDLAVLDRAFPDLTEDKAMQTNDRAEYEAYCVMANLRNAVGDKSLEAIIRQGLSADDRLQEDLRAAKEGAKSDDAPGKAGDRGKGRGR